ncbi:hypothetical protein HPB49_025734 [Dermacentor silvarum]|nr:hypothetical protein HPB49_025734 [Dermacentor silvarum]
MLWGAIWLVIIALSIVSTYLSYLVVMHKKASEFLSGINYSVDPCYDFESFACTGARQSPNLATSRRHFSNPWLAQFDNAARYLQDVLVKFDFKDEGPRTPDYNFLRKFYKKCKPEVTGTNTISVVERIRAVLRRIGLPRWPMLEVEDQLNLFDLLRESFLNLGIAGLFELRVRRDLQFGQPGHTRPYSFHIGPPKLYLPKEFLLRKEETPVFRKYEDRLTDVFRAFRSRVELTGIAREVIRLQYYLSKTDWYYFLADFYGDGDNYSVRDAAVNIWNVAYLEYLTRLFSDPYNKQVFLPSQERALVNYLGWLIVDDLGHIAFRHQPDFHRTGADVISTRNTVETCARLAMKMAPATSARIVFEATSYRRASIKAMKIEISDGTTSDDGVDSPEQLGPISALLGNHELTALFNYVAFSLAAFLSPALPHDETAEGLLVLSHGEHIPQVPEELQACVHLLARTYRFGALSLARQAVRRDSSDGNGYKYEGAMRTLVDGARDQVAALLRNRTTRMTSVELWTALQRLDTLRVVFLAEPEDSAEHLSRYYGAALASIDTARSLTQVRGPGHGKGAFARFTHQLSVVSFSTP